MECDVREVIRLLDGPTAAARLLGVKAPSVIEWRNRNAIPTERCAMVEKAINGRFKRWHMRPHDWHQIWPELIGAPDAPPVPTLPAGDRPAVNEPSMECKEAA